MIRKANRTGGRTGWVSGRIELAVYRYIGGLGQVGDVNRREQVTPVFDRLSGSVCVSQGWTRIYRGYGLNPLPLTRRSNKNLSIYSHWPRVGAFLPLLALFWRVGKTQFSTLWEGMFPVGSVQNVWQISKDESNGLNMDVPPGLGRLLTWGNMYTIDSPLPFFIYGLPSFHPNMFGTPFCLVIEQRVENHPDLLLRKI